jgi:hypothetical protein
MKRIPSVGESVKEVSVGDAWVVVHSFEVAQFYIETLCEAVSKNYRSFVAAAGEDWQIIGLFSSAQEASAAASAWIRTPGAIRAREGAIM